MSLTDNKVNWAQVEKWVAREGYKTNWKPFGMPEILDPNGSAFGDIKPMPQWDVPPKVAISTAITGAFFSRRANPNQAITPTEIRNSAEECIKAGAQIIHIHVRDDNGFNVLSPERFHEVIAPLKEKYPHVSFDGCLVAVTDEESAKMGPMMKTGLLEVIPVNTTAICCGDSMFTKSPHVVIGKTKMVLEAGLKPLIAVYDDGDIDNAKRYLIDTGLVDGPLYWCVLPALPGCSPMHSPYGMIDGLMRMVRQIREIDPTSVILVCAAGRPSVYLATLALLLGLHVRVGMEDTIWRWPHKDDLIESNVSAFEQIRLIASLLGREMMTGDEYRAAIGIPLVGATAPLVSAAMA